MPENIFIVLKMCVLLTVKGIIDKTLKANKTFTKRALERQTPTVYKSTVKKTSGKVNLGMGRKDKCKVSLTLKDLILWMNGVCLAIILFCTGEVYDHELSKKKNWLDKTSCDVFPGSVVQDHLLPPA